jgi:hypothetical protein
MKRLRASVVRIGGTDIQTTELECGTENRFHGFENFRRFDDGFEEAALIHGVGNAACAGLGAEFAAGALAFLHEQFFDALVEGGDALRREQGREEQISLFKKSGFGLG